MFSPGVEVDGVFTFSNGFNSKISLVICKKETAECTYKLAITYLGFDRDMKDSWCIKINDKTPLYDSGKLRSLSCRKLSIEPYKTGWKVVLPKDTVLKMKNNLFPIHLY
jgi:hypothetical protein